MPNPIITATQRRNTAAEYRAAATHDRNAAERYRQEGKTERAEVAEGRAASFERIADWNEQKGKE